jgi:hypothetical protein
MVGDVPFTGGSIGIASGNALLQPVRKIKTASKNESSNFILWMKDIQWFL